MENPTIEQLIAEAAARGALAFAAEEDRIASELDEHRVAEAQKDAQRRAAWVATLKGLPDWAAAKLDVQLGTYSHIDTWARLDLPGCVPILVNNECKLRVADYFEIECADEYVVNWSYGDPYALDKFDNAVYEATQLYPSWQAMHVERDRLNANPPQTPARISSTLETAVEVLRQFTNGDTLVRYEYNEDQIPMVCADDRAILIAAPLLALAQAVTRIAAALEERHG